MGAPGSGGSGPGAALSDETTIIQTRMVDGTLYAYAGSIPKLEGSKGEPIPFSQAEVEYDYLSERIEAYTSDGIEGSEISARNINGTLWRRPITWNLTTGSGSVGNRTQLDGGVGVYITDFALEYDRFVTLPSVDGTYIYEYNQVNEQEETFGSTYTYTREGEHATLTWKSHQSPTVHLMYEGAPLTSANLGVSFNLNNPFGFLTESLQDRYLSTWTIHENLNGVTGETGQFDMRRLSVRNLEVEPENFNPADPTEGEATISFDLVTYPLTSELTPSGWTPANGSNWMVEIAGPSSSAVVRTLSGTTPTANPDSSGVVANISATWNGTEDSGEPVLNGSYQIASQGLGLLGVANTYTQFSPAATIQVGTRKVTIENFTADPENFEPEEGESTTLTFEILVEGYENPSLSWEVEVYQDEEVVHTFPPGEGPGSQEAEGLHKRSVSYDWDGIGSDGPVTGEVEYRVRASACDGGVQPQSVNPISHRALFQSDGGVCNLAEENYVAFVGRGIKIVFKQDGVLVDRVRPSYLFEGYGEQLDPAPQPGDGPTDGPHAFGEASIVTVEVEVLDSFDKDEIELILYVTGDASESGHVHGDPPAGSFNQEAQIYPQSLRLFLETNPNSSVYLGLLQKGDSIQKEWVAPFASAEYTFEAREWTTGESLAKGSLNVEIENLRPLQSLFSETEMGADGIVAFIGQTDPHPQNHYGTVGLNNRLAAVVRTYRQKMDILDRNDMLPSVPFSPSKPSTYEKKVFINDMSLPKGGLFVVGHNVGPFLPVTGAEDGHWEHRTGKNADLITEPIDRGVDVLTKTPMRDKPLENSLHKYGFDIYNEIERFPDGPHYHIRLREGN